MDLFGCDRPAPLAPATPPHQPDLFTATAERKALRSGRPLSQERTELIAGTGLRCILDHALARRGRRKDGDLYCPVCDA